MLGRADLPNWDNLWSILHQEEELRRFTKKQHNSGLRKVKKEDEEDAALASKKQPKKKDFSKIKCFQRGEMGHFSSHCLEKKRDKEASSSKAAVENDGSGDDAAMSAHEPRRWGDMDM